MKKKELKMADVIDLADSIAQEITELRFVLEKLKSDAWIVSVSATWLEEPFIKHWKTDRCIYKQSIADFIARLIADTEAEIAKLTKELDAL